MLPLGFSLGCGALVRCCQLASARATVGFVFELSRCSDEAKPVSCFVGLWSFLVFDPTGLKHQANKAIGIITAVRLLWPHGWVIGQYRFAVDISPDFLMFRCQ